MNKLIYYLWVAAFFICIHPIKAKDTIKVRKNIVKINIVALGLKNYSLTYERAFKNNRALLMGTSYMPNSQVNALFFLPEYLFNVEHRKLTGYNFAPELRKYFVRCDDNNFGSGFYASAYLRYAHYNFTATMVDRIVGYDSYANFDIKYNELGIGIQLGYQVIIKDRFTFDIVAFGPRLSQFWLDIGLELHGEEDLPDQVEDWLNETFENFSLPDEINFSEDLKYKSNFTFGNFRYMLCIGYRF